MRNGCQGVAISGFQLDYQLVMLHCHPGSADPLEILTCLILMLKKSSGSPFLWTCGAVVCLERWRKFVDSKVAFLGFGAGGDMSRFRENSKLHNIN